MKIQSNTKGSPPCGGLEKKVSSLYYTEPFIILDLQKAEIEWLMTFPDCPEQDYKLMKKELADVNGIFKELKGGARREWKTK